VITGTPYVAAYAVKSSSIRILRVLHGAQKWPEELPADWPVTSVPPGPSDRSGPDRIVPRGQLSLR
jgi:hypothetical protein